MSSRNGNQMRTPIEQSIHDILLQVIDPEVGENIIDLGLVYSIQAKDSHATITLTLTSQACPMGAMLLEEIEAALTKKLPAGIDYKLELVWEPAWCPDMMSVAAKQRLGWD